MKSSFAKNRLLKFINWIIHKTSGTLFYLGGVILGGGYQRSDSNLLFFDFPNSWLSHTDRIQDSLQFFRIEQFLVLNYLDQ